MSLEINTLRSLNTSLTKDRVNLESMAGVDFDVIELQSFFYNNESLEVDYAKDKGNGVDDADKNENDEVQ